MNATRSLWLFGVLGLAACGAVAVPRERFYRLALPPVEAPDPQQAGVLRVHDLQLATSLDGDCLLQQEGVEVRTQPLARWVAPLDRLVTDAVVLGLARARVCELVKSGLDPGGETWSLRGRIVDFAEVRGEAGAMARVTLELWLEAGDRRLFHDEFTAVQPLGPAGPEAVVAALSRGLQEVVGAVVASMRQRDLFAAAKATAAAAAAVPAR